MSMTNECIFPLMIHLIHCKVKSVNDYTWLRKRNSITLLLQVRRVSGNSVNNVSLNSVCRKRSKLLKITQATHGKISKCYQSGQLSKKIKTMFRQCPYQPVQTLKTTRFITIHADCIKKTSLSWGHKIV